MQLQQKQFDYSLKNIPIPSKVTCMENFISKLESFIRWLRWKAYFFDTKVGECDKQMRENFGFKTELAPHQHLSLILFENDLYKMACSIEFRHRPNEFQQKLKADVISIKSSPHMLIPADKTTNLYEVNTKDYNKLLHDNITKSYKKASDTFEKCINQEAKKDCNWYKIRGQDSKISRKKNAFNTFKDVKKISKETLHVD